MGLVWTHGPGRADGLRVLEAPAIRDAECPVRKLPSWPTLSLRSVRSARLRYDLCFVGPRKVLARRAPQEKPL